MRGAYCLLSAVPTAAATTTTTASYSYKFYSSSLALITQGDIGILCLLGIIDGVGRRSFVVWGVILLSRGMVGCQILYFHVGIWCKLSWRESVITHFHSISSSLVASDSFRILSVPENFGKWFVGFVGFWGFSFGYSQDWKAFFCNSSFLQGWCAEEPRLT